MNVYAEERLVKAFERIAEALEQRNVLLEKSVAPQYVINVAENVDESVVKRIKDEIRAQRGPSDYRIDK